LSGGSDVCGAQWLFHFHEVPGRLRPEETAASRSPELPPRFVQRFLELSQRFVQRFLEFSQRFVQRFLELSQRFVQRYIVSNVNIQVFLSV
jgi:hypothetical protein